MSDTKALERALNLVLENDVLCASYGGVFREAAAELAELKAGISGLKSDNGQLGMYNERANLENKSLIKANVEVANLNIDLQEQNAQLRAERDEARKATIRAVNVLCETRKHKGRRPCNFCQLLIPEQWRPAFLQVHPKRR